MDEIEVKPSVHRWLKEKQHYLRQSPAFRRVKFGDLRRVTPISRVFGLERGQPIDRYYIETFLENHTDDIQGHVLEVGDNTYTKKLGNERVTKSDVLHAVGGSPVATIIGDLAQADHIVTDTFDCIILTQTLHCIYDVGAAAATLHRILKPGGVLLATIPGISQISRYDMDRWGDYWRFTSLSARRVFERYFDRDQITVQSYGNVLTAVSFLHGLAAGELRRHELDYVDPDYEVLIAVRCVK